MTETLTQAATATAALALVLTLIWIGGRFLRRAPLGFGPTGIAGPPITVGAVLALDSRRRVYVLTCHGRSVLLLTGGANDVVLGWLAEPQA